MDSRQSNIPAGAIFAILSLIFLIACFLEAHQPITVEEHCARKLGVRYSVDDGATERVDAFEDCVNGRRGR